MSSPPFLELPPPARAYRLQTERGVFAVLDATPPEGTARRGTALLVPGFTGSKEDFIALLEPLARAGFRVVAVDQRGQHESGGPRDEAAYAQDHLALDVLALTAALPGPRHPPGPVHLLGHSLGGLVVRAAVLSCDPARLPWASLTLLSSGPAAIEPAEAGRVKMLLGALPAMEMAAIWRAMKDLDAALEPPRSTSPEVADFLRRRWLANVPEQLAATGKQLLREPDRVGELAAVPIPKLVISGAQDYAWPVPWMDEMARRLSARRVVIDGAGHSPNAERPLATAEALAAFWTSAVRASAAREPQPPPRDPV